MEALNEQAWERWKAYRVAIRKPIKPASEDAMKLKLQRYGADQEAVVEQSISNGYQGLFDLKKSRPAPGERPVKTDKQVAADLEHFQYQQRQSEKFWNSQGLTSLNRLKLCEALWARYTVTEDSFTEERISWLKDVVRKYVKEVNARELLGEPGLMTMVWCFYGKKGVDYVRSRAE